MARPVNILMLMSDQHRFDCLGCVNEAIRTPNFDRIAAGGVRFSRAYSTTPTCTPARAGLLTGQAPWHHGMLGYGKVAPCYPVELPRLLREAGYFTFGIGKMHWFPQRALHGFHATLLDESGRRNHGFVSDYHRWFHRRAPGRDPLPGAMGLNWNGWQAGPYIYADELHPTFWTGDTAVRFLREYDRTAPFFLKVSFARPHSPYDGPQRFWDLYREQDLPAPATGEWTERFREHLDPPHPCQWHGDLGAAEAQHSRRGYYASVSFIDEQVGRILAALEERGFAEDTLILFCSDHGDMLGDLHLWRKSYAYEGSARIPFLVRWPRGLAPEAARGTVREEPVELRDVLPTFLDGAGAPVPEAVDGDSVLGLLRGDGPAWRAWIDLEHEACYTPQNQWNALTDGRWKYVYFSPTGEEQLFDLAEDPRETRDLAPDPGHASQLSTWRARLVGHLSERGEPFVRNGELLQRAEPMIYGPNYPMRVPPYVAPPK